MIIPPKLITDPPWLLFSVITNHLTIPLPKPFQFPVDQHMDLYIMVTDTSYSCWTRYCTSATVATHNLCFFTILMAGHGHYLLGPGHADFELPGKSGDNGWSYQVQPLAPIPPYQLGAVDPPCRTRAPHQ